MLFPLLVQVADNLVNLIRELMNLLCHDRQEVLAPLKNDLLFQGYLFLLPHLMIVLQLFENGDFRHQLLMPLSLLAPLLDDLLLLFILVGQLLLNKEPLLILLNLHLQIPGFLLDLLIDPLIVLLLFDILRFLRNPL